MITREEMIFQILLKLIDDNDKKCKFDNLVSDCLRAINVVNKIFDKRRKLEGGQAKNDYNLGMENPPDKKENKNLDGRGIHGEIHTITANEDGVAILHRGGTSTPEVFSWDKIKWLLNDFISKDEWIEYENLKCCGNCVHYIDDGCGLKSIKLIRAYSVCDQWGSDQQDFCGREKMGESDEIKQRKEW